MVQGSRKIKLYIAEEQRILRDAYLPFFATHPGIEVVGSSGETSADSIIGMARALQPDVVLLGTKVLQPATVEKLAAIRETCPGLALVLLFALYDAQGIKALREFSRGITAGCAFLLKYTFDTVEQIGQVVLSVAEGRIVVDPIVMEGLVADSEVPTSFLKELSARELEVLTWMAKGYKNDAIATVLSIEPKTVERHINNIYSKLKDCPQSKHPRIYAVMSYLRAVGLLNSELLEA